MCTQHHSGIENEVVDALSRCMNIVITLSIAITGFDHLQESSPFCPDFGLIYKRVVDGPSHYHSDFVLHDGFF